MYAEIGPDGFIEVDPEPYGDSFARPARLLGGASGLALASVLPNVAGGFLLQSVRAPAQVSALAAKKHLARNVINLGLPNYDR